MKLTRRSCFLTLAGGIANAAERNLLAEWQRAARETDGTVGAAALRLTSGRLVSLNGAERFPLASICKVPIAMNALALVDEGKLALSQEIEVLPQDIVSSVSKIAELWSGRRHFPLSELIERMVAQSDNTAVETLFRIGGGSAALAERFRKWKIEGIRVDRSERQCDLDRNGVDHYPPQSQWTDSVLNGLAAQATPAIRYRAVRRYLADTRDTGTPNGTVQLLARAFSGEILSPSSTAFLSDALKATTTFPTRLKGLLPAGTVVAHKTGSTGTVQGLTAATNDSGVIFLPNGSQLAVSIYIKASTRSDSVRDLVIAQMARSAYDLSR